MSGIARGKQLLIIIIGSFIMTVTGIVVIEMRTSFIGKSFGVMCLLIGFYLGISVVLSIGKYINSRYGNKNKK